MILSLLACQHIEEPAFAAPSWLSERLELEPQGVARILEHSREETLEVRVPSATPGILTNYAVLGLSTNYLIVEHEWIGGKLVSKEPLGAVMFTSELEPLGYHHVDSPQGCRLSGDPKVKPSPACTTEAKAFTHHVLHLLGAKAVAP